MSFINPYFILNPLKHFISPIKARNFADGKFIQQKTQCFIDISERVVQLFVLMMPSCGCSFDIVLQYGCITIIVYLGTFMTMFCKFAVVCLEHCAV